jgi:hypothetical protein
VGGVSPVPMQTRGLGQPSLSGSARIASQDRVRVYCYQNTIRVDEKTVRLKAIQRTRCLPCLAGCRSILAPLRFWLPMALPICVNHTTHARSPRAHRWADRPSVREYSRECYAAAGLAAG